jgi:hypothetical protein
MMFVRRCGPKINAGALFFDIVRRSILCPFRAEHLWVGSRLKPGLSPWDPFVTRN